MNLIELCATLKATAVSDIELPHYLLGAFRRKSISFCNGLTDETTLVYWFQSKSFSLDLRLKDPRETDVLERQAWIGNTLWDAKQQLLSWQITASYQNHVQWPEPAKLHPIGNALLEFSPSNAYVEDWRQQASCGLYLGLRLFKIENTTLNTSYAADGGLVICDHLMAFAQSRTPEVQQRVASYVSLAEGLAQQHISEQDLEDFELSVSLDGKNIALTTLSQQQGTVFDLEHFEMLDADTLVQTRKIRGQLCRLYFHLDVFQPNFLFAIESETSQDSQQWIKQERHHLLHHAKIIT